jgi:hypothetical protein
MAKGLRSTAAASTAYSIRVIDIMELRSCKEQILSHDSRCSNVLEAVSSATSVMSCGVYYPRYHHDGIERHLEYGQC